jgi:hypothetical protein
MKTPEELEKERYTEKGIMILIERIKSLIRIFNDKKFNSATRIIGFPNLVIMSREELIGRIRELADITFSKVTLKITKDKIGNKEEVREEFIYG